jgi:ABC-2 type transport system permease protein
MAKWFYIFNFTLKLSFNYILNEFFTGVYRLTILLGVLVVGLQTSNSDYLMSFVLTGSIFFSMTEPFISWELGEKIKNGQLVKELILPSSFLQVQLAKALARCFYLFVSYIPILIFLIICFGKYFVWDISRVWIFIPWFFVAFMIRFCLDLISATISFWTVEFSGPVYMIFNILMILSGAIFPLSYLPANFQWIKQLPFAYVLEHPMQIYLGKYDTIQGLTYFFYGVIWVLFILFLTKKFFYFGLKKYESVGL